MQRIDRWEVPPQWPELRQSMVHVWLVSLAPPAGLDGPLWGALDDHERARARRLARAGDRARYVAAHAALRVIIGCYAGIHPRRLTFEHGPNGKPALAVDQAGGLRFNLAHSDGLALCAVALGGEVGVDLERVRPLAELAAIAEQLFAPDELGALGALPEAQRLRGFYTMWTRKEAYLKATGDGLLGADRGVDLSAWPEPPRAAAATQPGSGGPARWSLHTIELGMGYSAALVAEAPGSGLHQLRWSWFSPLLRAALG